MGLKIRFLPLSLLISSVSLLHAAPMLRLANSAIGPVTTGTGANGATQTIEAYNAGDGSLSLSLSSSVTWIAPTVGASRACTTINAGGPCLPLQLALNTSSLAAGTYTGIVTVTSSNSATVDAPQTITVTVQVGGGVPTKVDQYVAPGTTVDIPFSTNSMISGVPSTTDGGRWLSLSLEGTGSFRFVFPYHIRLAPATDMTPGTYNGTVVTSGSTVASENKSIPVTMRVTTQPIAQPSSNTINVRVAQGSPVLTYPYLPLLTLTNIGQGTLASQDPTATTASGGNWLTVAPYPNSAILTIDPSTLATGVYTGSVTIPTNAAAGAVTVPLNLEVVAKAAPLIYYQGVVDNGTYIHGDTVAQGDVMIVQGEQLISVAAASGPAPPLATTIGGASVLVNGKQVPMYYASAGQLAFQMPVDTPLGTALVQVQRDGTASNTVSVNVAARAPRLLAVVNPDGSVNTGDPAHPAHIGDTLVIYAIGLGATNPAALTGQPAPLSPLAQVAGDLTVNFGGGAIGVLASPAFAGLTPTYAGLYQINVVVPDGTPKGLVYIKASFADAGSNAFPIYMQ